MSWHLQNQVDQNAEAGVYKSIYETAVMRALASFANHDGGSCYPGLNTLAQRSQCSERKARSVLQTFKKRGWITIKHTGRSNHYQIMAHGSVAPERVAPHADQTGTACRREWSHMPIRTAPDANYSYQILLSKNTPQSLSEEEEEKRNGLGGNKKPENPSSATSSSVTETVSPSFRRVGVLTPLDAPDNLLQALDIWPSIVEVIGKRRPLIVSLIERATPIRYEDTNLTLGFPSAHAPSLELLARPNNQRAIEQVLASIFGGTWKVAFESRADLPGPDPAGIDPNHEHQRAEQERDELPPMPSLEEMRRETRKLGLPDSDADWLHRQWAEHGYRSGGRRVRDWRALMRKYAHTGSFPSEEAKARMEDLKARFRAMKHRDEEKKQSMPGTTRGRGNHRQDCSNETTFKQVALQD